MPTSTVASLVGPWCGASVVTRAPEQVKRRIEPNDTSTFSLNVSVSCAGDTAATPSFGGSLDWSTACAHAGAAVATSMIPTTAGTTHSLASRPALMRASHYGVGHVMPHAARLSELRSRAVAWD